MGKHNIISSEDRIFEPTKYWKPYIPDTGTSGYATSTIYGKNYSEMTDEEKARATSKKIVQRFLLIKKLFNELFEQVSTTRAIDILLEECEKEGCMDRNELNKAIYGRRKKV